MLMSIRKKCGEVKCTIKIHLSSFGDETIGKYVHNIVGHLM